MHGDSVTTRSGRPYKHIHDFIAKDAKHYARKVAREIREKTDTLNELPNIGKQVPELDDTSLRELHIYSYRILFEVEQLRAGGDSQKTRFCT